MIPWPIGLLTLFYGAMAALSAATVWKMLFDVTDRSIVLPLAWLTLSATLMCGLPLLKSWARTLAVGASLLMMLFTLSLAALLVMRGQPGVAVLATCGAGVHGVIIRYLQRPVVKTYFQSDIRYQSEL